MRGLIKLVLTFWICALALILYSLFTTLVNMPNTGAVAVGVFLLGCDICMAAFGMWLLWRDDLKHSKEEIKRCLRGNEDE